LKTHRECLLLDCIELRYTLSPIIAVKLNSVILPLFQYTIYVIWGGLADIRLSARDLASRHSQPCVQSID